MSSGTKYNRRSFLARVAGPTLLIGSASAAVSGCASTGVTDSDPFDFPGSGRGTGGAGVTDQDPTDRAGYGRGSTRDPGTAYNQRGWNGAEYISHNQTYAAQDLNGEVGHPLSVYGPYGECGNGSAYSRSMYVQSGTLPPGLHLDSSSGTISGIPTERGHWIVTLVNTPACGGSVAFATKTQQLRFHITGSGQVIQ